MKYGVYTGSMRCSLTTKAYIILPEGLDPRRDQGYDAIPLAVFPYVTALEKEQAETLAFEYMHYTNRRQEAMEKAAREVKLCVSK